MQDQQQSPIQTPTTPSTPNLPLFPLDSSFIGRRSSVPSATTMRRRNSSVLSIPSSPLDTTISRPLPIRPQKVTKRPTSPAPSHRPQPRSPSPKYHLQVLANAATSGFKTALSHLETPLVPLISVTSGLPHPSFPTSILRYHLLTHEQLDELARFYHQVTPPVRETFRYPARIPAWVSVNEEEDAERVVEVDLETKRRRWGRFVGLRGCETPTEEREDGWGMEERMEREWRRALERARDEERLREKGWRVGW